MVLDLLLPLSLVTHNRDLNPFSNGVSSYFSILDSWTIKERVSLSMFIWLKSVKSYIWTTIASNLFLNKFSNHSWVWKVFTILSQVIQRAVIGCLFKTRMDKAVWSWSLFEFLPSTLLIVKYLILNKLPCRFDDFDDAQFTPSSENCLGFLWLENEGFKKNMDLTLKLKDPYKIYRVLFFIKKWINYINHSPSKSN